MSLSKKKLPKLKKPFSLVFPKKIPAKLQRLATSSCKTQQLIILTKKNKRESPKERLKK